MEALAAGVVEAVQQTRATTVVLVEREHVVRSEYGVIREVNDATQIR